MNSDSPRAPFDVRIGARQQGDDVGAAGEGAPRLGAVDDPTFVAADLRRFGAAAHRGDVGADVRLGDRDRRHDLAGGELRQPVLLLFFGTALEQRLGENLGPRDQAAGGGQRAARQLLGGHDHRQVAHAAAAVLLGNRHAEETELGHLGDQLVGHQVVLAVDVLGQRRHLALGELPHRVAGHHRHLVADRRVVDPARPDDVAADGAESAVGDRRSRGGDDLGRGDGRGEAVFADAELVEMSDHLGSELEGELAGKGGRHGRHHGVTRAVAAGIGQEVAGGCQLGGRVRQTFAVHLLVVDTLAAIGALARDLQCLLDDRLGRRNNLLRRLQIRLQFHSITPLLARRWLRPTPDNG
jgi:hypothetical protein